MLHCLLNDASNCAEDDCQSPGIEGIERYAPIWMSKVQQMMSLLVPGDSYSANIPVAFLILGALLRYPIVIMRGQWFV
jgi:hypothetical protein